MYKISHQNKPEVAFPSEEKITSMVAVWAGTLVPGGKRGP